ncbi:VanW family protein [Deinococcus fonticola]|uniref:VanW family protein n=1 Tax=Deinococcus fonticola TaxID=2528713 RepID=UPI001074B26F|nr:VanW family protein [Deinococcus fonticola]
MMFNRRAALLLSGVLLVTSTPVSAQTPPPAVPAAPAPATPAPATPTTPPPAAPAPAAPTAAPTMASGPLLVTVQAQIPALIDGKKTTTAFVRTLSIPVERAAQIRKAGKITASLDAELNRFMDMLEKVGEDARFMQVDDGTQWAVVQRNNLKIDREATRANVLAVLKDRFAVQAAVVVTGQTPPKRTLDFFVQKGITNFLATGQTSYDGSSPERITNIHVGARNFKDRLFEGKTFSFNQMIGPISTRSGYVAGLVIAGDQTASGVGGGICQVSTTVFRTLYGAGLPIVQRQNHSYQVYYYAPQGLDATIYQPSLDLKFSNDTGGALWFQTDWDDQEKVLSISVFGKAPKYDVVVDAPKTLSTTPSPKDRFINDPSMKLGERKQVDWAAPGAVIEVTRRFLKGGQEVKKDTLKSTYRPWPNIFRVGTRK